MQKRTKLLVIAGVFNVVGFLFLMYTAYALIHNVSGVTDMVTAFVLEQYGSGDVAYYLNFATGYFIIAAIVNCVAAIVFFIYAKLNIKIFTKFKTILITVLIITTLAGLNIISLILVISAFYYASTESAPHPSHEQLVGVEAFYNKSNLKNTTERIEYVKKLKKGGKISEAEYIKLLEEIIANSVH